jgi:hypothetical protein
MFDAGLLVAPVRALHGYRGLDGQDRRRADGAQTFALRCSKPSNLSMFAAR